MLIYAQYFALKSQEISFNPISNLNIVMGLTSHLVISTISILCIFPMKIHSNLRIYNQQFQVWGPSEGGM